MSDPPDSPLGMKASVSADVPPSMPAVLPLQRRVRATPSAATASADISTVPRVLIIYTGGTFGMQRGEDGSLKPMALGDRLKALGEFQHPDMPVWDLESWGMCADAPRVWING
jgi:hypothetical protein